MVAGLATGAGIDALILLHAPLPAPFLPLLVLAAVAAAAARRFPA